MRKEKVEVFSLSQPRVANLGSPSQVLEKLEQRAPREPKGQVLAKKTTSIKTSNASADVELNGDGGSDLTEVIDSDELLEMFDVMGVDDTAEVVAKFPRVEDSDDEDSERSQELLRSPTIRRPKPRPKSRARSVERVTEETEGAPRSRWFMTTCRYCGNIYRFRSDQLQPPTCGRPQCISKFEESSRTATVELRK
jgi:rubrerythrin